MIVNCVFAFPVVLPVAIYKALLLRRKYLVHFCSGDQGTEVHQLSLQDGNH